jgi:NADH-quinone oxidoreductase subunit L
MNRIGDLGLLVGIFILGNLFSTRLCYFKTALLVQQIYDILYCCFALFIGACVNQHKFHCILVTRCDGGPTPVSALIHGYDGNCRNFMITRLNFI